MAPNDEEYLRQRLAQLTPSDMVRGIVLNGALTVVRQLEGEAAAQRCLEVTGETRFLDFFNYPTGAFLRLLHAAAQLLADRHGGYEGALRQLGQQSSRNFTASLSGKSLLVLSQGDLKRLINKLPEGFKVLVNAGESEVHWPEPTCGVLTLQRDMAPRAYTESGILALCSTFKRRELTVRSWQVGPLSNAYEIRWTA